MSGKTIVSENALSVTELSSRIKNFIDSPVFQGLEVYGEVSGFKFSGRHAYFTLKDKDSQIQCSWWNAITSPIKVKEGDSVIIRGKIDYYEKMGKLSLIVNTIEINGQGLLFLEFEKLKAKLLAEGIFDESHKVQIPTFVKKVLVVTSVTGAVIRDINTTIRKKNPLINIVVKDVRVQGVGAGKEIARVLPQLDKLGYDVIIIARGGGSLEDLAPFYDEDLVRAIYDCVTPVVSAVGHETDFSLCDFVADARAATPTAAGELVAWDYYELVDVLNYDIDRLKKNVVDIFQKSSSRVKVAASNIQRLTSAFYANREHRISLLFQRMRTAVDNNFTSKENRLNHMATALDNLSPLKVLSRGYFRLSSGEKTISRVQSLNVGQIINAVGQDGEAKLEVKEINVKEVK